MRGQKQFGNRWVIETKHTYNKIVKQSSCSTFDIQYGVDHMKSNLYINIYFLNNTNFFADNNFLKK